MCYVFKLKTYVSITFLLFVLFALCLTLNERGKKTQKHQNNSQKKKKKLKYMVNYFFCRKWRKNCFKKRKEEKKKMKMKLIILHCVTERKNNLFHFYFF